MGEERAKMSVRAVIRLMCLHRQMAAAGGSDLYRNCHVAHAFATTIGKRNVLSKKISSGDERIRRMEGLLNYPQTGQY